MKIFAYYNSFKCGLSCRDKIKEYAKQHRLHITYTFSDNTQYGRDGLYSLFETMKEEEVKNVLVYSLESLWTDEELHYLVVNKFMSLGAEIMSVCEPSYSIYDDEILNNNNSISDYIKTLINSFTAVNLAHARSLKAEQGKKPCGNIPFGYIRNADDDIIINDLEAPTLTLIFEEYKSLKSLSKLETYLSNNDYYNRNNKPFQKGTLAKMLKNDFYIGYVTYDGKKHKGNHKQLIETDLFYDVQSILARNNTTTKI